MFSKILSISIAAYNAEKDISNCLSSMVNSSVIDLLDIIVVNDGSKDRTFDVAKTFSEKWPNSVRVINKENGGHGSTINTGIIEAKGKYFKIVDSDDWVDTTGLEKLVEFLSDSDVDLVMNPFNTVKIDSKNNVTSRDPCPKILNKNQIYSVEQLTGQETLHMHSITFKTDAIKKVGPVIDEHCFYVDMEYTVFPIMNIKTFCYLDFVVYQYQLGAITQSVSLQNMIKRRNEHKKVIISLINFYNSNFNNVCKTLKDISIKRISQAIYSQYAIYLQMGNRGAKEELDRFCCELNSLNFDYLEFIGSKSKKILLTILGHKSYLAFFLMSLIYRKIKK